MIHISNIITIQTCKQCGRLANVQITCSRWACHACGDLVQSVEYTPNDFERLVRIVCPVGGNPDDVGVMLGNVGFWIDADGPWAGQLSFSHPTNAWDLPALKRDLTRRLQEVTNAA